MHYLHVNDLFHSDWIKAVHDTLNHLGLSDMWLSHDTFYSQAAFKNNIRSRINDQYKQDWKSSIDGAEKCLNYRLYKKELQFESHFNILPLPLAKHIYLRNKETQQILWVTKTCFVMQVCGITGRLI